MRTTSLRLRYRYHIDCHPEVALIIRLYWLWVEYFCDRNLFR